MSVFTFDPNGADPARAASPWLRPADPRDKSSLPDRPAARKGAIGTGLLSDYQITRLEPEPQDGPTEYKLHLLLRPRRKYEQISTASRISGSTQRPPSDAKTVKSATAITGSSTTSAQTRQNRLEHLTTQLLWRLQQSCPYHAGSAAPQLVIPQLPDERIARDSPIKLGKVLPGLEGSRGALYEIGVADDGTLAGLTKDELDESLYILKVMAASLGCTVNVLRRLEVGHCEWIEPGAVEAVEAKLWVAEALVTPDLRPRDAGQQAVIGRTQGAARSAEALPDPKQGPLSTDQLRVTLTGPTTSGKSTLLGTLSTGTLDNGRGKGRLGLLKHLHEVTTGITSSVTQELVGYERDNIINYAHSGIESWIDIHDYTKSGRLVYLVDSAGHPRYRRTILRGIVGWAPHWTLLCIAADSAEFGSAVGGTSSALDVLGPAGASVDLASAHLDLCLRLCLPLVIVVTKLDLASRQSVKNTLGKILSSVKRAGRTPMMVKTGPAGHTDLSRVSEEDDALVGGIVDALGTNDGPLSIIPIVLTSAVDGRGIGSLHALLRKLPLPPTPTSHDYIGAALNPEQPACLFHIEDKYNMPASCALATSDADQDTELGTVVAGYLRFGSLSIGDKVVVGPFPAEDDSSPDTTPGERSPGGAYGLSLSHPSSADLNRAAFKNTVSASAVKGEWHTASIASIRNLRMPVQTLTAGQVGSIGIIFYDSPAQAIAEGEARYPSTMPRLRKGMVLAVPSQHMVSSGLLLQAVSGLTAVFNHSNREVGSLSVGSLVNIYVASVRTAARVSRVSRVKTQDDGSRMATDELDDIFSLTDDMDGGNNMEMGVDGEVEVQLDLMSTREWIELGSRILVLEGGSKDRSGLEGYVGKVVEIVE